VTDETVHHDDVTHMDTHATVSDDDHGHGGEVLGPIDWDKWAYALAGGAAALVVLVVFLFALGGLPA
jgi:hypothetical protein